MVKAATLISKAAPKKLKFMPDFYIKQDTLHIWVGGGPQDKSYS